MALLIIIFILISLAVILSSLSACITYMQYASPHSPYSFEHHQNYTMWAEHGVLMCIIIMFVIIVWLVFANITIVYDLFNCNDGLYAFLNVFFIVIATFLLFFILFRELGLN